MNKIFFACVTLLFVASCHTKKEFKLPDVLPENSIYNLTSEWKTQEGETVQLKNFGGKINVAAMIFTACRSACPRITADLQRIDAGLKNKHKSDVRFLLISMDPERDTPEKLKKFALDHKLDLSRWTLLTGNADDVMEIANVLDVRFKASKENGIDHSNIIHVIDPSGVIVHQQVGLAIEPDETLRAIEKLYE
ncbi:MAG: SCO family protein [Chitinophagales bacterium]|nr:SCO family protein [Chitinophagales bacterium]